DASGTLASPWKVLARQGEIMSGKLDLQLSGSSEWRPITAGQSFEVPGASSFTVRVSEPTDYCCSFIK
ncbi:MAG TPA: pyrimidine/purine nucleoside phosphorylase, partial [Pseudomonadales bacterium]|nr:pyrimidine/purine nucleoside phosphorylase [Pseudomonadales bacterium]